jgi:hypothetical protein
MRPEAITPPTSHAHKGQFLQSVTIQVVPPAVFYGVGKRCNTPPGGSNPQDIHMPLAAVGAGLFSAASGKELPTSPGLHHASTHSQCRRSARKNPVLSKHMSPESAHAGPSRSRIDGCSHPASIVSSARRRAIP